MTVISKILSTGLKAITSSKTLGGKWGRKIETHTRILEKDGNEWKTIIERFKEIRPNTDMFRMQSTKYNIGNSLREENKFYFKNGTTSQASRTDYIG